MKYSNVDLFEKRFKEKKQLNSILMTRHVKSLSTSINKSQLNFDLSSSTLPSSKKIIFSNGRNNKRIKEFKDITKHNSDCFNKNNLYLTQSLLFEDKKIIRSKSNKKILLSNLLNNEIFCTTNKNNKKENENKILCLFEKVRILPKLKDSKKKNDLEIKNKILHNKKQKVREYINKTRDIQLLKFTTSIQKERNIRLKEKYDNEIERVEDEIKLINESSKLFNDKFINKFNDNVKQLFTKRENEKTRSIHLMKEIIKYKNEISLLESKIRKVEYDKYNIIRWIYFQICVNEQILKIPIHYKAIIEENEEDFKKNLYGEKKEKAIISNSLNNNNNTNNSPNREISKNYMKRDTIRKSIIKINSKKIKSNDKKENDLTEKASTIKTYVFGSIYKNLPKKEVERIRKYRYSVKFNTIDDFLNQFKLFENKNINHIYKYNSINEELLQLKKEKNSMIIEWKKEMNYTLNLIEIKENELNDIKNKNKCLLEQLENITNETNEKYKNEKRLYLKNKLYLSIISLFKKFSQMNYNYCEEILKNKKTLTEEEILFILQKIESQIDYLNNKFKIYKIQNEEQMKILINNIEKQHQIEKTKKQREEEEDKNDKLKEKIKKRNDRFYLYPRRKIEKYFSFQYKSIKFKLDEDIIKEPSFDDYI